MTTTNTTKITGRIVGVSRRRFLGGTAVAIATTGVVLLPQQTVGSNEPISLEHAASALHEVVGRFSDQSAPFDLDRSAPQSSRSTSLDYAMEHLRYCSVDEIQGLLKPLFGGVS